MEIAEKTQTAAALIAAGVHPSELLSLDVNETIQIVRAALKRRSGKTWSVTRGKGTAYGWITITAPPARRVSSFAGGGRYYMSDADRAELGALLGHDGPVHSQGETVPASTDFRRCVLESALGLTKISGATPYWD